MGDPGRLRQVLINLVGNGVKFTQKGEVVFASARLAGERQEARVQFSVRDTGIGIAADKQQLIFEAFAQADGSITRRYGGTGLGLAISTQLVELMGGRIWVESEPGAGSTFHFTAAFELPQTARPLSPATQSLNGLRVLVVDDHATNRRILCEMLSRWGMLPAVAESGETALAAMRQAKAEARPFPLVLLDLHMPALDGLQVAEHITHDPALTESAVILLTSAGIPRAGKRRLPGIRACVSKPLKQSELFDVIMTTMTEGRRARSRPAPRRSSGKKLRILLAEDKPVNQTVAIHLLRKLGHSATVAGNGREALEMFRKGAQGIDAILMDIQMPEMDGFEATAAIRSEEKKTGGHVPIIAMTADALREDRERCLASGMDGYVSKPVREQELFDAIRQAMGAEMPVKSDEEEMNAIRERFPGDNRLLRELVRLFLADVPSMMEQIRTALANGNAEALRIAAHTLKGSISNFATAGAWETALELEGVARRGELSTAAGVQQALEARMAALTRTLEALSRHSAGRKGTGHEKNPGSRG